jgi:hypothetical protein
MAGDLLCWWCRGPLSGHIDVFDDPIGIYLNKIEDIEVVELEDLE